MGCTQSPGANKPKKIGNKYSVQEVIESEQISNIDLIQNYTRSEMYNDKKVLGSGTYSTVSMVTSVSNPNMKFAVKSMPKIVDGKLLKSTILNEMYTLRKLDHPGIIYCNELYETETHIDAIIELCEGPTLEKYICGAAYGLTSEKLLIMYQLAKVAAYLKSQNMVHRDFKTANVLLHDNNDRFGQTKNSKINEGLLFDPMVQVIDFGFIKDSSSDKNCCGSPKYMAPEAFKRISSFASDVWAIGIIFYNLISGDFPFSGIDRLDLYESISMDALEFNPYAVWKDVPTPVTELISKMLEKNPAKRIAIEDVVNHIIFDEVNELSRKTKLHLTEIDILDRYAQLTPIESAFASYATRFLENSIKNPMRERFMMLDKENTGKVTLKRLPKNFKIIGGEAGSTAKTSASTITNERVSNAGDSGQKCNDYHFTYSNYVAAVVDPDVLLSDDNINSIFDS